MRASTAYSLLVIAICALCTFGERLLPFLIFGRRRVPRVVQYLGRVLPMAIMTALVVYCLRNVDVLHFAYGLPELIAIAVTISLHLWKRQMLLSIAGGTACYMLLVQFVF